MKLIKSDFRGCTKVYSFTLKQLVGNRANILSFAITFVIILLIMPIMTLINASNTQTVDNNFIPPQIVYVYNETSYPLDFAADSYPMFADTKFEDVDYSLVEYTVDASHAFLHIYNDTEGKISIDVASEEDTASILSSYALEILNNAKLRAAGASSLQVNVLAAPHSVSVSSMSDYGSAEEDNSMSGYYLQLIYSIITMIVSMYTSAYIVQTVVEEKASKLVESTYDKCKAACADSWKNTCSNDICIWYVSVECCCSLTIRCNKHCHITWRQLQRSCFQNGW